MLTPANICQVAIVSKHAKLLRNWYCEHFGFLPASQTIFGGPLATRVQGVPNDLNICYWAVDGKRQFQLEFFNFIRPGVTPKRNNWQPYDHGYNVVGIYTWNFDEILNKLKRSSASFLSDVKIDNGHRWLMIKDPDGNHIELTEHDPLAEQTKQYEEISATVRYVRISVPDLEKTKKIWKNSFYLLEKDTYTLPTYHDELLFSEQVTEYQQCVLQGQGILLELRQYSKPVPTPRLNTHDVTDQGIMNIAIGADSVALWDEYFNNAIERQCIPNGKPLDAAVFKVMYLNQPNLENIELLYPRQWAYSLTGFKPSGVFARGEIIINTCEETLWAILIDHDNAGQWAFFSSKLIQKGETEIDGLKAVRKIGLFGLTFEEKITNWLPNKSYSYQLRSKILFRNHQGIIYLSPRNGRIKLSWQIHFDTPILGLGAINRIILTLLINRSLKKLKKRAESPTN
ncbi:MAG: SRPBCC family protein [Paraglaciecola sp.]|uniref:SRPBCC family protein n=1 Tax=Paraglaciecola sp. TaxID=1920173 RepID=UPI0032987921